MTNRTKCIHCDEEISVKANTCPVCRKSQGPKSLIAKVVATRDYFTFPIAVFALVAAIYYPVKKTALELMSWDGGSLKGHLSTPGLINIGFDDRPISNRSDEVKKTEYFLRMSLSNVGHSTVAINNSFNCAGTTTGGRRWIHTFRFIDIKSMITEYPELGESSTRYFHLVHTGSQMDPVEQRSEKVDSTVTDNDFNSCQGAEFDHSKPVFGHLTDNTCQTSYSDKYGVEYFIVELAGLNRSNFPFPLTPQAECPK